MNTWIKDAVFYQIYPTSFYDSNNDGIGDIQGIIEKLDYVKSLGVNAIWFNPFYPSPFYDGGYDVSDYCAVHEKLGTIQDFEQLITRCKEFGIRVVIDLVVGHTSVEHKWFKESAKDERNKYSDYYIWTDSNFNKFQDKSIHGLYPRDGGYVINYYACQPALNYGFNDKPRERDENNAYDLGEDWKMHYTDERLRPLREEILNVMRFWLEKGVDGFRVDLANSLVKGCVYNSDKDEDTKGLQWLWNILIGTIKKEYPDTAFIAEWVYPVNSVGKCGFDLDYLAHDEPTYNQLLRNEQGTNILPAFEMGKTYFSKEGMGNITEFLKYTKRLYDEIGDKGCFSVPSGYHDIVRLAEKKSQNQLKTTFAFLLTYKHVPFIYYGDEIGMKHTFGINKDGGYVRTGARTPMQWDNGKNCGFSTYSQTYLPVNECKTPTVEDMEREKDSLLNTVRKLIEIRKSSSAFSATGGLEIVSCENGGYPLIFRRYNETESFIIAINPSKEQKLISIKGKTICSLNAQSTEDGTLLNEESFLIVKEK